MIDVWLGNRVPCLAGYRSMRNICYTIIHCCAGHVAGDAKQTHDTAKMLCNTCASHASLLTYTG